MWITLKQYSNLHVFKKYYKIRQQRDREEASRKAQRFTYCMGPLLGNLEVRIRQIRRNPICQ